DRNVTGVQTCALPISAGAATVLDVYPLSQQGESGRVLGVSAVASGLGGIISAIILSTLAPFLAEQALRFGAAEYFSVAIFGMSEIGRASCRDSGKRER